MRREDEIKAAEALDPALGDLTRNLHAAQDAADAAAKATEDKAIADAERAEQRAKLESDLANAQDALRAAYERTTTKLEQSKSKWQGFADTVRGVVESLSSRSASSLRAEFNRVGQAAAGGDENAFGRLSALAPDVADSIRANATSAVDLKRGLAAMRLTLTSAEGFAKTQVDVADLQLTALNTQVGQMIDLNAGMLSVDEAIRGLVTAEAQLLTAFGNGIITNADEISGLREEMRAALATIARNTADAARALDGATTPGGLELNVAA